MRGQAGHAVNATLACETDYRFPVRCQLPPYSGHYSQSTQMEREREMPLDRTTAASAAELMVRNLKRKRLKPQRQRMEYSPHGVLAQRRCRGDADASRAASAMSSRHPDQDPVDIRDDGSLGHRRHVGARAV